MSVNKPIFMVYWNKLLVNMINTSGQHTYNGDDYLITSRVGEGDFSIKKLHMGIINRGAAVV